jgi:hypothetical protein
MLKSKKVLVYITINILNNINNMLKSKKVLTCATIIMILASMPTMVFSMTSENYSIFADTVNYGGNRSVSSDFIIFDSIGEGGIFDTSTSTSSNYALSAGFQSQSLANFISASTTPSDVNLGNFSPSSVVSANLKLGVSTNATFGYTTTIAADGEFREGTNPSINIPAVTDGAVTAGSAEYGIRTSGADGAFNSADQGLSTSAQTLASKSNWTSYAETTITFKASVAQGTPFGSYSQNVTITTTPNY